MAASQDTQKISVEAVTKVFDGRKGSEPVVALESVDLSVRSGEFIAIVGASGCGKTTLLRIIGSLDRPSAGQVCIDGQVRTEPGPDRGFVFQKDNLFPWRTVRENISFGLEMSGTARKERIEKADELAAIVGLGGFEKHYPHELSGGMRQRANLARAFCILPEVLLMDEPFAALDALTRESMQSELLRIWSETGGTVVFITHQIEEAVYLADRVVVMTPRPGKINRIVDIPFSRPRDLAIKRSHEFRELYDAIWDDVSRPAGSNSDQAGPTFVGN